jgi:hypothetical protein
MTYATNMPERVLSPMSVTGVTNYIPGNIWKAISGHFGPFRYLHRGFPYVILYVWKNVQKPLFVFWRIKDETGIDSQQTLAVPFC